MDHNTYVRNKFDISVDFLETLNSVVSEQKKKDVESLIEGKISDDWQQGAKSVKLGSVELVRGKSGSHDIKIKGKNVGNFSYDEEADNFVANVKESKGQVVADDIDSLISQVSKMNEEIIDEALSTYKVNIDGGVATVSAASEDAAILKAARKMKISKAFAKEYVSGAKRKKVKVVKEEKEVKKDKEKLNIKQGKNKVDVDPTLDSEQST